MRQSHFGIRLLTRTVVAVAALAFAGTAAGERYLVVYEGNGVPGSAGRAIERAGGTLVFAYGAIGVAVAESSDPGFAAAVLGAPKVTGVAPAGLFGAEGAEAEGPPPGGLPNVPATDADTFSGLQWNMRQIHAPEAHAVTGGSPAVSVGVIDTGVDATHPDLDDNLDDARSVSCAGGAPVAGGWNDDSGHGTHVMGVIAAESNGIGVVGVAPRVQLVAIKASVRVGSRDIFTPLAVVCALMYAGSAQLDVANASFAVDKPDVTDALDFWCHGDPADQAVITAVQRAAGYALKQGVSLVASAGNSNLDLANPPLGNDCVRLPSELPGVVTVSATRLNGQKASYSNYGVGVIDVAAPGGEVPPFAPPPTEFILSTWPANPLLFSATTLCDPVSTPCPPPGTALGVSYYRFMAGTSQAAAHVSGVAALVISRFGDLRSPQNGKLRPGQVEAILQQTANPQPCPPQPTTCEGGETNGWYGHGVVDAFRAITHNSGN